MRPTEVELLVDCPVCNLPVPELWQPFWSVSDPNGWGTSEPQQALNYLYEGMKRGIHMTVQWMQCPNPECKDFFIRVDRYEYDPTHSEPGKSRIHTKIPEQNKQVWIVPTSQKVRPVDPLVPAGVRRDYEEASRILSASPRMSSVLSRRILADLLTHNAGLAGYTLNEQINQFLADAKYPSALKDNLHHLREMGNFSAHTKMDTVTGEIIDVTLIEAEWTLDVLDGLFDYFITGPARDAARRAAMDEKLRQAGRKPAAKPKDGEDA
jgi:Domain of unknown function (DUF4145)